MRKRWPLLIGVDLRDIAKLQRGCLASGARRCLRVGRRPLCLGQVVVWQEKKPPDRGLFRLSGWAESMYVSEVTIDW
jgi:hypothetical protein